ncbi:toxin-antitoxin system YwqK family antitoxin [Polaribacter sp. Asnod1-A03]|uniref:toxin-antitoxin system YwqK family antitoxin n=1 Tax=Polaribacter sp. Asnod1-A03 TaxID=3160581 RepID=UPI00386C6C03
MKPFFLILLFASLFSCQKEKLATPVLKNQVPSFFVLKSKTNAKNNLLYVADKIYSGFVYQLNSVTADTLLISGYYNGLKEGVSKKWYANNQLMETRYYSSGQKNGKQVAFWENGSKRFDYTAKKDAYEGEFKEWNMNGKLIHLAHYRNGQEEGAQKLWYDNGKIRANYVIIDGKRYGLLGTKNCVNVSDRIFTDK